MQKYKNSVECLKFDKESQRIKKFEIAKYRFHYKSDPKDKLILDKIIEQGKKLAKNVNPGKANFGKSERSIERVINNSVAGLLAEFVWMDFIRHHNIECRETVYTEAKEQIDIELIASNKTFKTIEVRSSFPRNGIKFALCHHKHQFDVIGPYNNDYKYSEIKKDFYVRTLFPFESKALLTNLYNDNFSVFLTGGATWEMFNDKKKTIVKDFIPEDEINIENLENPSSYLVLPFSNALDTFEIIDEFK